MTPKTVTAVPVKLELIVTSGVESAMVSFSARPDRLRRSTRAKSERHEPAHGAISVIGVSE